jgi:hypothetical protein
MNKISSRKRSGRFHERSIALRFLMAAAGIAMLATGSLVPVRAHAQSAGGMAITITPPFFELNVNPGDTWSSSIKVVNTNQSDMTVQTEVAGFRAAGDYGNGTFVGLSDLAGDTDALANWISLPAASVLIPRGGAAEVPFSVRIPTDASPGGHYAAILIGTGASPAEKGVSQVGVSTFISALIFVRVSGNVTEAASIQDFSSDRSFYQSPDVHFSVLVRNDGNVHVRPVGTIQIYNAFGKERGEIPVNGTGTLGYVLPSSSREFSATWQSGLNLFDIGPYTAVVTLAYGEHGTKSISRTIGFWILPINQILEGLLILLAAILFFWFVIKRIVRRMLAMEMSKYGDAPGPQAPRGFKTEKNRRENRSSGEIPAPPIKDQGVIDLRSRKEE